MYEILYLIYFYIDDYRTACNFWLLNKFFTKNYMKKYNKNYEYKFKLLTSDLNNLLKIITPQNNINNCILDKNDDIYIITNRNDLKFCYNLYKKFLINEFFKCDFDYNKECSWCSLMIYYIFHEGDKILNKICKIKYVQNKVSLLTNFTKKHELMQFLAYSNTFNGYYIKKYKTNIENALK